jgi:hypothetical protein
MTNHRFRRLVEGWRELEDAGVPLEPLELRAGSNGHGLTIRHEPHAYEAGYIREIRLGRIAYMLPVFIRRDGPGQTIIRNCTLQAPWDDSIEWLEEDREKNAGWYTFSEETYPRKHEYPRHMVLNHRMAGTLSRGCIREGVLLGVGRAPVPETYGSGDKIPITLKILDQWDCEPSATFNLQLTRCRTLAKETHKSARGPLFSSRDPVVVHNTLRALPAPVTEDRDEKKEWDEIIAAIQFCAAAVKDAQNKRREDELARLSGLSVSTGM